MRRWLKGSFGAGVFGFCLAVLSPFLFTLCAANFNVNSYVLGCPMRSLQEVADKRMLVNMKAIVDNTSYALHHAGENLSSKVQ